MIEGVVLQDLINHLDERGRVLELDRSVVLKGLQRLVNEHRLIAAQESRYRFSHAKIREVVLDGLLPEQMAIWHGRLADHLEQAGRGSAATIARHLMAAGRQEEAVPQLLDAALAAKDQAATEMTDSMRTILSRSFDAGRPTRM